MEAGVHAVASAIKRCSKASSTSSYDVINDPDETNNVVDAHPDVDEPLKLELQRIIATTGPIAGLTVRQPRYTEAELDSLRALGYIR